MTSPPPSDKKPGGFVPPPPGYLPPGARGEPPATAEPEPPPEPTAAESEPPPEPTPAEPEPPAELAPEPDIEAEPASERVVAPPVTAPPVADKPVATPVDKPAPAAKHTSPPVVQPAPATESPRLPRVAWLAAVPGVAALISAVLPWFAPTGRGVAIPKAYCLQAGRVGFLAPLAIIVAVVIVLGPRIGVFGKGQPTRRLDTDGLILGGAGIAAAVVLGLTWLLLPSSYSFTGTTWDRLNAAGHHLTRGPQAGFLIGIAAAALAIVGGVVLLLAGRRDPQ